MAYTPTYTTGDIPLMTGDAIGTVGAAAVPLIPLAVGAGVVYWGAKHGKKKYDKYKKSGSRSGKGWWSDTFGHSAAAKKGKTKMWRK